MRKIGILLVINTIVGQRTLSDTDGLKMECVATKNQCLV